jgi:hypothetical protein
MSEHDYQGVIDPEPVADKFAELNKVVLDIRMAEAVCEDYADKLKKAQEHLRDLNARRLPELMQSYGLSEFKTRDGLKVELKVEIECGISEERRPAALKWLEDNGHSGLIKRLINVAFNRDQADQAQALLEELQKTYPAATANQTVHPSTLKAWVKTMLAEGAPLPTDLFGVFERKVAKIHQAKK